MPGALLNQDFIYCWIIRNNSLLNSTILFYSLLLLAVNGQSLCDPVLPGISCYNYMTAFLPFWLHKSDTPCIYLMLCLLDKRNFCRNCFSLLDLLEKSVRAESEEKDERQQVQASPVNHCCSDAVQHHPEWPLPLPAPPPAGAAHQHILKKVNAASNP